VIWSGVRSAGHGSTDVGDAVDKVLLDVTEVLGATCVLDDESGLVAATELLEVLLAKEESEGPSTDDVQPAKSKAADTARGAIADPRTIDRVITLPSKCGNARRWRRTVVDRTRGADHSDSPPLSFSQRLLLCGTSALNAGNTEWPLCTRMEYGTGR
jgi:hypothetical protein